MRSQDEHFNADMAFAVMSALRTVADHAVSRVFPDPNLERDRAQRWHNRLQALQTLLSLYEWRYALLPVGIRESTQTFLRGNLMLQVTARQLHVFGIRLARWVVRTETHQLAGPTAAAPRVRLRPWRRRKSVALKS